MEQFTIILMEKEQETGFLTKERGAYTVTGNEAYLQQVYAMDSPDGIQVFIKLTCEKETEDWEYEAIFDYYDIDALLPYAKTVSEEDEHFNPVWTVVVPFSENQEEMETVFSDILQAHHVELQTVYDAIADKKDDYIEQ